MQIINYYLRADSIKATAVDKWNQPLSVIPTLTRGMHATLVLNLLDADGEPVSASDLAQYTTWDFAIAHDWNTTTLPQIRVVSGIEQVNNTICIPLLETNTEPLIKALGTNEQVNFGCELAGFEAGSDTPSYLLQFNIIIRNRRCDAGTGIPTQVDDGMYTAAQVRALMSASMEVQVSADGTSWHTTEELPEGARYFRFRNEAIAGEWSDPLPLIIGDVPLVDAYTKEETNALLDNKLSVTKSEDGTSTIVSDALILNGSTSFSSTPTFLSGIQVNGCTLLNGEVTITSSSSLYVNGTASFYGTPHFCGGATFTGSVAVSTSMSFNNGGYLNIGCDCYLSNSGVFQQYGTSELYGSIYIYNSVDFSGCDSVVFNLGCATVILGCTNLNSWITTVNNKLCIG